MPLKVLIEVLRRLLQDGVSPNADVIVCLRHGIHTKHDIALTVNTPTVVSKRHTRFHKEGVVILHTRD